MNNHICLQLQSSRDSNCDISIVLVVVVPVVVGGCGGQRKLGQVQTHHVCVSVVHRLVHNFWWILKAIYTICFLYGHFILFMKFAWQVMEQKDWDTHHLVHWSWVTILSKIPYHSAWQFLVSKVPLKKCAIFEKKMLHFYKNCLGKISKKNSKKSDIVTKGR